MPFTTSFHTRFPDYVSIRTGIPADWLWKMMRWFHGAAARTFVVTPTLAGELEPGEMLEIRFEESVSKLAQLPGATFYHRIREKFGKLA